MMNNIKKLMLEVGTLLLLAFVLTTLPTTSLIITDTIVSEAETQTNSDDPTRPADGPTLGRS